MSTHKIMLVSAKHGARSNLGNTFLIQKWDAFSFWNLFISFFFEEQKAIVPLISKIVSEQLFL